MADLLLPAPAKINLCLYVIDKRADGFHELQTVFQFVDLCDWLEFEVLDRPDIIVNGIDNIAAEQNLVYRAAKLLQQHTGTKLGAQIHLQKHIPMQAGLGGGSSDAATTLLGLNYLWDLQLSNTQLQALGLQLGSDVPIFVYGIAAEGRGRGEQLQPLDPEENWLVLLNPGCDCPTGEIFSQIHLTEPQQIRKICSSLQGAGGNDLEPIVNKLYPPVADAISWLSQFGDARMSGSGSTVFAGFATSVAAQEVLDKVPGKFTALRAKARNISPCHKILAQIIGV